MSTKGIEKVWELPPPNKNDEKRPLPVNNEPATISSSRTGPSTRTSNASYASVAINSYVHEVRTQQDQIGNSGPVARKPAQISTSQVNRTQANPASQAPDLYSNAPPPYPPPKSGPITRSSAYRPPPSQASNANLNQGDFSISQGPRDGGEKLIENPDNLSVSWAEDDFIAECEQVDPEPPAPLPGRGAAYANPNVRPAADEDGGVSANATAAAPRKVVTKNGWLTPMSHNKKRKRERSGQKKYPLLAGAQIAVHRDVLVRRLDYQQCECYADIEEMVRLYCRDRGVMTVQVNAIPYAPDDTQIGCKVTVKEDDYETLLVKGFWPKPAFARQWYRKPRNNANEDEADGGDPEA